jgi:MATE family multidrug resistance protein
LASQRILRFKREATILLRIGFPVMIGNLLQVSMSFVDTVMAGNLSPEDLAAVAIGSSILMPIYILGIGILMGISPIVAQHFGARRLDQIGPTAKNGLILAVLIGIPSAIALWFTEPILSFMSVDEALFPKTIGYAQAVSFGIIPVYIFLALRYFNEGLANTKPAMWISFIGLMFNIGGNYVLMYGKLGFPAMGAIGTGYATAIVMSVMGIGMFLYTYLKASYADFEIFREVYRAKKRHLVELIRIGGPIGMSMWMEVTMFAVVALIIGSLGTLDVAAHQIALNFASVTFMLAFGVSSGITVRVGQVFGQYGLADARYSGRVGILIATAFMGFTGILMFAIPEAIIGLYTSDPELIERAIALLYMAAIFQLSDGLQVSGSGALRGLKDTTIPMYVNFLSYWVIGLPLGWVLGIHLGYGPEGLWIGLIAGLSVAALLHNVRFHLISRPSTLPS